jgi:hypothetical protein
MLIGTMFQGQAVFAAMRFLDEREMHKVRSLVNRGTHCSMGIRLLCTVILREADHNRQLIPQEDGQPSAGWEFVSGIDKWKL